MRIVNRIFFVSLFFTCSVIAGNAQPFADDISRFRKQDSVSMPPKNAILFIGSSSFTMWKDVKEHFPGFTIINRGFGGSSLTDLIRYANEVIIPYRPKQVVIYCGENDLAGSDTVSSKMVLARFTELFAIIRKNLPRTHITYVSMKPSPSRHYLVLKLQEGNELIRKFLQKKRRTSFVNVYSSMVDDEGRPMKDLFLEDMLHMNEKGYAIWQKLIQPYLIK